MVIKNGLNEHMNTYSRYNFRGRANLEISEFVTGKLERGGIHIFRLATFVTATVIFQCKHSSRYRYLFDLNVICYVTYQINLSLFKASFLYFLCKTTFSHIQIAHMKHNDATTMRASRYTIAH